MKNNIPSMKVHSDKFNDKFLTNTVQWPIEIAWELLKRVSRESLEYRGNEAKFVPIDRIKLRQYYGR